MGQLVGIGGGIVGRQQVAVQGEFAEEGTHAARDAHHRDERGEEHRLGPRSVGRGREYTQRRADGTIAAYHLVAYHVGVDGIDRGVRSVQPLNVVVRKAGEVLGRIGCVGDARPLVEVGLRVVQSPGQVEPDVYPEQVLHLATNDAPPGFLAAEAGVKRPDNQPGDAEGDEEVAHGEGDEVGHGGQHSGYAGVNVSGVAGSGSGQELYEPYRQYQCHQYKVALLEVSASPVQRSVGPLLCIS